MLIRLLQQFGAFALAQEEACPAAVPPPGWAQTRGSNGKDRVKFSAHLTMYVQVSDMRPVCVRRLQSTFIRVGCGYAWRRPRKTILKKDVSIHISSILQV